MRKQKELSHATTVMIATHAKGLEDTLGREQLDFFQEKKLVKVMVSIRGGKGAIKKGLPVDYVRAMVTVTIPAGNKQESCFSHR